MDKSNAMAKLPFLIALLLAFTCFVQASPKEPKLLLHFKGQPPSNRQITTVLPFIENLFGWNNYADAIVFDNQNCFNLTKSSSNVTIEVHFKFGNTTHDSTKSRKIFQLDGQQVSKQFCIDEYIYLNRMKSYQLEFHFSDGSIEQPFELKLFEWISDKFSIVQEPQNATISGGWLFYNSIFDYSFEGPNENATFFACDLSAHCFSYQPTVQGKKVLYSLPEDVRQALLVNTPFIRIHTDQNVDSEKYQLKYSNAPAEYLSKLKSHYHDSVLTNGTLVFHKKVRNQDKIPISIPLNLIDLRFQQVVCTLEIIAGNFSYLKLSGVNLTKGGFAWPHANIDSDNVFYLSTREFLALGPADTSGYTLANKTLNYIFQVAFDPNISQDKLLDVKITLELKPVSLIVGLHSAFIENFPKQMFDFLKFKPDSQTELQLIDWSYAQNRSNGSDWIDRNRLTMNLTDDFIAIGAQLSEENLRVSRVIFGSHGTFFSVTPMKLAFVNQNKSALLNDEIHFGQLPPHDDYFKIGYLISRKNIKLNEVFGEKLHVHNRYFSSENCQKTPTFSPLDCDKMEFHCPAYMSFDAKLGSCKFSWINN